MGNSEFIITGSGSGNFSRKQKGHLFGIFWPFLLLRSKPSRICHEENVYTSRLFRCGASVINSLGVATMGIMRPDRRFDRAQYPVKSLNYSLNPWGLYRHDDDFIYVSLFVSRSGLCRYVCILSKGPNTLTWRPAAIKCEC